MIDNSLQAEWAAALAVFKEARQRGDAARAAVDRSLYTDPIDDFSTSAGEPRGDLGALYAEQDAAQQAEHEARTELVRLRDLIQSAS